MDKVPDFALVKDVPDTEYPGFWISLQSWLQTKGLFFLEMQLPPNMPFMPLPYSPLCILFGETANGIKHAIVGKIEGSEFIAVFNPWPEAELASGVGAIGFIIPRDPAYYVRMGRALAKVERISRTLSEDQPGRASEIHAIAQEALGENQPAMFSPNGTR